MKSGQTMVCSTSTSPLDWSGTGTDFHSCQSKWLSHMNSHAFNDMLVKFTLTFLILLKSNLSYSCRPSFLFFFFFKCEHLCALQEVLWWKDWPLLCLVGSLHPDADSCFLSGSLCLSLWMCNSRRQHPKVTAYLLKRKKSQFFENFPPNFSLLVSFQHGNLPPKEQHHHVSSVWHSVRLLET